MGWKAWLAAAGISGLVTLFKYTEWTVCWSQTSSAALVDAQAWVDAGDSFTNTSSSMSAIVNCINSFNDLMQDINAGNLDLIKEWQELDPNTGLYVLRDFCLVLPNGLAFKIIDGGVIQTFSISNSVGQWKGFVFPNNGNQWAIAMRLTADPNLEFMIPGTDAYNFIDPLDGVVKPGSDCTPVQGIMDNDVIYLYNCFVLFYFICNVLSSLGMVDTLKAWYNKYTLRRSFTKIRDKIADLGVSLEELDLKVNALSGDLDMLSIDWNTALTDSDKSKIADVFKQLKRLGYRPYG